MNQKTSRWKLNIVADHLVVGVEHGCRVPDLHGASLSGVGARRLVDVPVCVVVWALASSAAALPPSKNGRSR